MLQNFVLVSFIVNCSHKVLKASNIDLVVKDALKVLKVNLFGQDSVKLRFVRLTV